MDIAIVIALLIIVIILFASRKYSVEMMMISLLVILTATRILTPSEAFSGFGTDYLIIIAALFIISSGLQQTGVLDLLGSGLLNRPKMKAGSLITYVMSTVGLTSAFMNNTTATTVFISPVIALARKMKMSASRLLMPVAYASIIGGTCTVIGTSTNIAVNGYLGKEGLDSFAIFEFLPIGLAMFVVTLLYMVTIGRSLLPAYATAELSEEQELRKYVTEILIMPDSDLIGERIFESKLSKMGFRILNVMRDNVNFLPDHSTSIQADDLLIVEGDMENLLKVKETVDIEIRADVLIREALQSEQIRLVEVLVTPQSEFVNTSLKNANFRQRYNLVVLAINRSGQTLRQKIGDVVLRVGDVLLVQGSVEKINYFKSSRDITIMEDFKPILYKRQRGIFTLIVFAIAILLGALNWLPLSTSLIIAVALIVLSESLSIEKAYEAIDWRLLILVGGMSALALAITKTGVANFLSHQLLHIFSSYNPQNILALLIVITVLLTLPMNNVAAALIMLPIAIQTAQQMGVSHKPFVIGVMLAASLSFITPFEPSCILVRGPGQYKFRDYLKTGLPLTLLLTFVLYKMILIYYSF